MLAHDDPIRLVLARNQQRARARTHREYYRQGQMARGNIHLAVVKTAFLNRGLERSTEKTLHKAWLQNLPHYKNKVRRRQTNITDLPYLGPRCVLCKREENITHVLTGRCHSEYWRNRVAALANELNDACSDDYDNSILSKVSGTSVHAPHHVNAPHLMDSQIPADSTTAEHRPTLAPASPSPRGANAPCHGKPTQHRQLNAWVPHLNMLWLNPSLSSATMPPRPDPSTTCAPQPQTQTEPRLKRDAALQTELARHSLNQVDPCRTALGACPTQFSTYAQTAFPDSNASKLWGLIVCHNMASINEVLKRSTKARTTAACQFRLTVPDVKQWPPVPYKLNATEYRKLIERQETKTETTDATESDLDAATPEVSLRRSLGGDPPSATSAERGSLPVAPKRPSPSGNRRRRKKP